MMGCYLMAYLKDHNMYEDEIAISCILDCVGRRGRTWIAMATMKLCSLLFIDHSSDAFPKCGYIAPGQQRMSFFFLNR